MWNAYLSATSIEEVIQALAANNAPDAMGTARIVAGATDLILEMERGQRPGLETLIDVSRIAGLDQITYDEDCVIHLGPLVTHNICVESKLIREHALPLARACWEVGSPQIRNRGTVAGNLVTASPANDTITPLMALGAWVTLRSLRGERSVALEDFYTGVRRTVLAPDEMLVDIAFPALKNGQRGMFLKYALRQAQAISLLNVAVVVDMAGDAVQQARITLGAVAPTIIHAKDAEEYLRGKPLNAETIREAGKLAGAAARPISDLRASAHYRQRMTQVLTRRALQAIAEGSELAGFPEFAVLLAGPNLAQPVNHHAVMHTAGQPIVTRINGKTISLESGQNKTLLRLLREDAGLIGSKEGCAEGECGACTVFLDGAAVMSCMVPAPRAHGAEIITIEGLAEYERGRQGLAMDGEDRAGNLSPVQTAFMEEGAVQCGYCTPGFLMSAAKLLEERPNPNQDEIRQAMTGNLCRCTGYYKIIQAVERAAAYTTDLASVRDPATHVAE